MSLQAIIRRSIATAFIQTRAGSHTLTSSLTETPSSLSTVFSLGSIRSFAATSYLDKNEVTDRVLSVVKNFDKVDQSKISPTAVFQKDLGLDSLDTVELVMAIEEEFAIEIPDTEADKITSCDEAIAYISSNPMAK
ncbi:Acyl carrier protein 2 [Picochlorum sp. SENEW3]|nr:Acyl carrier protein 2 [Picochlorum sp. SENEW3]